MMPLRCPAPLSLLATVLLLACSSTTAESPSAPPEEAAAADPGMTGEVVILSSRDEKLLKPLVQLIEARNPQLKVTVDYGKDAGYLDRLAAEKDAPRADLYLSKASAPVASAAAAGLLEPLPADLLARVPERFRAADFAWTGLSARARIIVARRMLGSPPTSVLDLAEPRFNGRVARTVATNGSFVGGIAALLADRGEPVTQRFLEGLGNNTADGVNVHPKHTPAVAAVAEGQADVALVNHYYFYRRVLGTTASADATAADAERAVSEANIVAVYPDSDGTGVAWNVTGAGLVAGAPHREQALAVLELLLSDEGQKAFAWANREYPVVPSVPSPPGVVPPSDFKWSATSLSELASHNERAVQLVRDAGLR